MDSPIPDAGRARNSFVALAPESSGDGILTVGEILAAPESLSADLVVLSACETGLGNQRQAEGTVGLQRAFLAKGARSTGQSLGRVRSGDTNTHVGILPPLVVGFGSPIES